VLAGNDVLVGLVKFPVMFGGICCGGVSQGVVNEFATISGINIPTKPAAAPDQLIIFSLVSGASFSFKREELTDFKASIRAVFPKTTDVAILYGSVIALA